MEELEEKIEELEETIKQNNANVIEIINKRANEVFTGVLTMFIITWIVMYFK